MPSGVPLLQGLEKAHSFSPIRGVLGSAEDHVNVPSFKCDTARTVANMEHSEWRASVLLLKYLNL